MRSSSSLVTPLEPRNSAWARHCRTGQAFAIGAALWLCQTPAFAEKLVNGFGVERLELAPAGASYIVMDDLGFDGRIGGALSVSAGYAQNPLHVANRDGKNYLSVVSDQAFLTAGMAVHYGRLRAHLDLSNPIYARGQSGRIGPYQYNAPSVDLGKYPDKVTDVRLGLDVRLWGGAHDPLRIGFGSQLFIPSGERAAYFTDGTYRVSLRLLMAGGSHIFDYAAYAGIHVRQRNEADVPGAPRGSELIFGIAIGPRIAIGASETTTLHIGPEVFGETALLAAFGSDTTGLEALLSARVQHSDDTGRVIRFKLGFGDGIHREFGAPDWRCAVSLEMLGSVQ
jgi:hypothetical protein